MTQKRIFILNGHPAKTSLSSQFAERYENAAKTAGHEVRTSHLWGMRFDPDLGDGQFKEPKTLEPDLEKFLENLRWSNHFVMMAPMWWGGLPAKLKGLFDRTFLPGIAFDPRTIKNGLPLPLLDNRTGRLIITSDTPNWYFHLVYRAAMMRQIRNQILGFVGIKPVAFSHYSPASKPKPKPETVTRWLAQVEKMGTKGA